MSADPLFTPQPQAWYTRHPDPPWGVSCADCGEVGERGIDKRAAFDLADHHAREVHGVNQPVAEADFTDAMREKVLGWLQG